MVQLFMLHPGPLVPSPPAVPDGTEMRLATEQDAVALASVLTASFAEAWTPERVDRELLRANDVVATWVALVEGGLVGTASERLASDHPGHGYLHWVGVHPDAQGRRLGELLTRACLAGFAQRDLPSAVLETDDFRHAAVRSYLRVGFIPEYRSTDERHAWSHVLQELTTSRTKGPLVHHD